MTALWSSGDVAQQADEADEAFGGTVARTEVPPHARGGRVGRGHRFAAYPEVLGGLRHQQATEEVPQRRARLCLRWA